MRIRLSMLVLAIALGCTLGGCARSASRAALPSAPAAAQPTTSAASTSASAAASPATRSATAIVEFKTIYSSIASLREASTLVVRGRVLDTSYFESEQIVYTNVTLLVEQSSDPTASQGTTITVVDNGGEDPKTHTQILLDGAPLTLPREELVYFLSDKARNGLLPGKYYDVVGAYQGKFVVQDNIAERYSNQQVPPLQIDLNTVNVFGPRPK